MWISKTTDMVIVKCNVKHRSALVLNPKMLHTIIVCAKFLSIIVEFCTPFTLFSVKITVKGNSIYDWHQNIKQGESKRTSVRAIGSLKNQSFILATNNKRNAISRYEWSLKRWWAKKKGYQKIIETQMTYISAVQGPEYKWTSIGIFLISQ